MTKTQATKYIVREKFLGMKPLADILKGLIIDELKKLERGNNPDLLDKSGHFMVQYKYLNPNTDCSYGGKKLWNN